MLPHVPDLCTPPALNVVNHLPNGGIGDLGLPPRRLADAVVVAEGAVAGAAGYLEAVEDLVVRETVPEAVLGQADNFVVLGDPCAAVLFLLCGEGDLCVVLERGGQRMVWTWMD